MRLKTTQLNFKQGLLWLVLLFSSLSWGQYTGTGTFSKVTSLSELTDGYYVITNESSQNLMTSGRSGTDNGGFFLREVVSLENNNIVDPATANVWKIETHSNGKSIYSESINKYVGWSSGNAASIVNNVTNQSTWVFSYADNKFTVNNYATPVRQLSYNNGAPRFAAYDNANQHELQFYKLAEVSPQPVLPPVVTANMGLVGNVGSAFNYPVVATNNPTSFIVQNLPDGLSLNATTGVISGTPTTAGVLNFTVTATNAAGPSTPTTFTITVGKGTQTASFQDLVRALNEGTITLPANTSAALPITYVSSNTNVATVFDNTLNLVALGTTTITATQAGNDNYNPFTADFQLQVVELPTITNGFVFTTEGATVILPFVVTPANATVSLASGATLPAGLSIVGNTITGLPTQAGEFTVQLIASANGLISAPATFNITVLGTSTSTCLTEDFNSLIGGDNISNSGSNVPVNNNEIPLFPTVSRAYSAGGAVRIGASSNSGSLQSSPLSISGNVTVTVNVKGWTNVEGSLKVSLGASSQTQSYTARMSDDFETLTFNFLGVSTGSVLKIETTEKRAFIDEVNICSGVDATFLELCEGATIATLNGHFATESDLTWYATATSTVAIATDFILLEGIYYKQIGSATTRAAYKVELTQAPEAPTVVVGAFCGSATVANLPQSNADGQLKWYTVQAGGEALTLTESLVNNTTYYVSVVTGCESVNRTPVLVTINTLPNAPVVAAQVFCDSATVSDLPQENGTYRWYIVQTGGTALATTESLTNGTTYYVAVTDNNGCESLRTPVLVTINTLPDAPVVAAQVFCDSAQVLNLPQENGTYKWYTVQTGGTALATTQSLINGTTYYVAVTNNNGCESLRTPVLVTINTLPDAPVVAAQVFCGSASVSDLPQTNATGNFKWYTALTGGTALATTQSLVDGTTYYVSVINNNGCESLRTPVLVTINTLPNAPVVAAQVFCGSAQVLNLPQENGTYKWYTVETGGVALATTESLTSGALYYVSVTDNNGCESLRTPVLVTINTLPIAPVVAAQVFCDSAQVLNLPQENGTYKWYTVQTGGIALATTESLTNGTTYYVSVTDNNGCESLRTPVLVSITTTPLAPTVGNQTFCSSATVLDLPQTNTAGNLKWYTVETGGTALVTTESLTNGTTYYVAAVNANNCESSRTAVVVTINPIPQTPSFATQTFCGEQTIASLSQSNGVGVYKWFRNTTGGSALAPNIALESTTYYVSLTVNGCESLRAPVQIIVNTIPAAPAVQNQIFCNTATVAELPNGNGAFKWYGSQADNLPLLNTVSLVSGTTYYVSTTVNGCESVKKAVVVTINPIPSAPSVAAQTFCGSATVAILPQGSTNEVYKYYETLTGGTALELTANLSSRTYYVSKIVNTCESTRSAVTVLINPKPSAPVLSTQVFCGSAKVLNLPQENGSYKWYTAQTGGTPLVGTTDLVNGSTYYVSTTVNGCESDRTAVQVTINTVPLAPVVAAQVFCDSATVANLPSGDGTYKWYNSSTSVTALSATTVLNDGIYYVTTSNGQCESVTRTPVSVTILTTPSLPVIAAQSFCGSAKVLDLPQANGTYKWYVNPTGGAALSNTVTLVNGTTYYVSQSNGICESARVAVVVSVTNVPAVTGSSVQTFCNDAVVSDLFVSGIPNAEIVWYNASNLNVPLSLSTPLSTGVYYVEQRLNGCVSERKAITVRVSSALAPRVSSFEFCGSATVADLVIISETGVTHKWYRSANGTTALTENTSLTSGTYYVSRVQYGCESIRAAVMVTINNIPSSPVGSSTQTFLEGATINNLVVQPTTTAWFISEEDALTLTNQLSPLMPLVQGTTYYGVVIGTNGCPSLPFVVTVNITLSNDDFVKEHVKMYPNPILDYVTIDHTEIINEVVVYNLLGQQIFAKSNNDITIKIDFSSYASGSYVIKVKTNKGEASVKVIKK